MLNISSAELATVIDALVCDRESGEVVPLRPDEIAQEKFIPTGTVGTS